jgi:hypothetical protein
MSEQNGNGNVVDHIKVGGVVATIWRNENDGKVSLSVTLERSYKDRNGEWKKSHSLRQNDLPKALLALQKAFETIALSRVE